MNEAVQILIGAVMALIAGFFYQKTKRESAEALNKNFEDVKDNMKKDAQILKNSALNEVEEEKRSKLQKDSEAERAKVLSDEELKKFFTSNNDGHDGG